MDNVKKRDYSSLHRKLKESAGLYQKKHTHVSKIPESDIVTIQEECCKE